MTDDLDPFERRLGRHLDEFADAALPGAASIDDVIKQATRARARNPSSLVGGAFASIAIAVGIAVVTFARTGLRGPTVGAVASTGGGASPTALATPKAAGCEPNAFIDLTRAVTYDYQPIDSPRDLRDLVDAVVLGQIRDGVLVDAENGVATTRLRVDVKSLIKGDIGQAIDVDIPGDSSDREVLRSVAGCDVMLFLDGDGRRTFRPVAQGFWLQGPDALVGIYAAIDPKMPGWSGITSLDELREAVE